MLERDADIVIIGSGAGGGTAALALAPLCAQGVRILVLEAGPKLRPEEYTGREVEMARRLYADEGGFLTEDRTMSIAFGRAYGGSTVVYTGTSLTITEPTVRRWGVPGLDHEDLLERSRKYLVQNRVHLLPDADINDNNRLFEQGCRRLRLPRRAVSAEPRRLPRRGPVQSRVPERREDGHAPRPTA